MGKRNFLLERFKSIFKLTGIIIITSLIIFILIFLFYFIDNFSDTTVAKEELCIIQDKHTKENEESFIPITAHYLDVSVEGSEKEHSVLVTKEVYDVVSIGSKVKCEVTYSESKVLDVIFSNLD